MGDQQLSFLLELEAVIEDRLRNPLAGSYTASLAADGVRRVAQKVGEEAVELALAAAAGDREETVSEAADLLYHMQVLLAIQNLKLADVVDALRERHAS